MTDLVAVTVTDQPPIEVTVPTDDGTTVNVTVTTPAVIAPVVTGVAGPAGPPGSVTTAWPVPSPAATWTITHNLGHRPAVQLVDSTGALFDADVEHADLNTVVITHAAPISGYALLT